MKVLVEIDGSPVLATIDTGAEVTVMSEDLFQLVGDSSKKSQQEISMSLTVAEAGRKMEARGLYPFTMKIGDHTFELVSVCSTNQ